jgi:hypothetical protein
VFQDIIDWKRANFLNQAFHCFLPFQVGSDPIKYALSAINKYEGVQKTNKRAHARVLNPKSSLLTVIQSEELHQVIFILS